MRMQLLASVLLLAACGSGRAQTSQTSGAEETRAFPVTAFDSVGLGGCHDVMVTVGPAPSVRAVGGAHALDRLKVEVKGGALEIGSKEHFVSCRGNRDKVTVYVTTPRLSGAAIGGSGNMQIDKAEGESFDASIGGSGSIRIGALRVQHAEFAIGGSGNIEAAGSAGEASFAIGGSGSIDASGLMSRNASISIAGSGSADTRVSDQADISIAGSGNATIKGTRNCKVSRIGSGKARCTA